ncbi:MAG: hypothetical protein NC390_08365 [Fusobacterium sp.]|nr:hypothetical protein [Fusobacterium sp.]
MVDGINGTGSSQPIRDSRSNAKSKPLSAAEIEVFKKADLNGNGQIDADELDTLNDLLKSLEEESSTVEETQAANAEEISEEPESAENKTHKLTVNYKDTWYGIVQAKYGITDHKQTMEIVRQLKAHNNVDPKATNMPQEIELLDSVTLKNGEEIKITDIDAEVDKSHWQAKPQAPTEEKVVSKTGRYTITQNGVTKYYAADGTELKQSYYEAREAAESQRDVSKNGTGRYSYTASNGETWYFAADGTPLKKEYYEQRETEHTVINQQRKIAQASRTSFQQQLDNDGWAGKTADALSILWGSDNRACKVEADLQAYDVQIQELQQASKQGAVQFNAKFKELYGVNYNPANIAEYERNPTPENYRKAYGTQNDIHKRVMDYNQSQQDGAAAVKTTTVVVASTAAAIATGGTSLLATAAVAAATTATTRVAVEVSDLATNNVDGDVSENLGNIAEQAAIEGTIAGVTAGTMKGIGGAIGRGTSKAASVEAGGLVRAEQNAATGGLVRAEQQSATSSFVNSGAANGSRAGSSAGNTTGASARAGANTTGQTAGNATNSGAQAGASSTTNSAGSAANAGAQAAGNTAASSTATREFIKDVGSKVASRGGLSNLTVAERNKLSQIIGSDVSKISTMTKSEIRQLALKFHPDKAPEAQKELYQEIFQIIWNIK